ncbi:TetR/AcrR family transcriptional regulator [Sphingopyxis panaciterrulae]|uniref:AcrR family transcriptional regulator n=1 Tax=Sphingopyxis panaciterrulae TaxID=462372 RepID=A0A7W9B5M3_9SPHN|nr:TetR family transcriptional regulator [Sphingopyxis panaciterrulae]MBB5706730.1 AcrR family transcriptional regulator [Sphingopyxis panaciterrulae]
MATKIEIPARDADRTRQAILDAAQQVFAEKGFAEAGVRDITARAGVNPSLVSRYFGGKLKLFEAALDAVLDARLMTDLPRQGFGRLIVARFADEDDRVSPLPMLFRAAADSEARAVAQRLLRDRVFEPLQKWFGGEGADVKAARFMMVSLGFFAYRDQLPLAEFAGAVEPRLRRWLEEEFQAIVDD